MSNTILGGAEAMPLKKEGTLAEAYQEMVKQKALAQQYVPHGALGGPLGQVIQNPAPTAHDVLRVERATTQKLIFTVEKIDNGFVVTAYEDKVTSGISSELFKSFIEDPTNFGEVAIKALAIAGLSK